MKKIQKYNHQKRLRQQLLLLVTVVVILTLFTLSTKLQQHASSKLVRTTTEAPLNVYLDREYLPNAIHQSTTTTTTTLPASWKRDAVQLWKEFDQVQRDCSNPFRKIRVPNYGVSSSIIHAVNVAWRSWIMGCGVILERKKKWKWEEDNTWPSIMHPLDQTCVLKGNVEMAGPDFTVNRWDMDGTEEHLWDAESSNARLEYALSFRERYGDLVFAAVTTAYFLQEMLEHTDRQECIGIHIRRGDSCGKNDGYQQKGFVRSCPPFETYFDAAAKLRNRYGWNEVFVATDSPDMASIEKVAKKYGFVIKSQTMDRSKYDSTTLIDERIKGISKKGQAAQEVYYDISRLVSCKGLIGSLHSTMDQLVLQLMVYHHDAVPPFVSVDDPWCPVFGGNNFCPSYRRSCKCVKYSDDSGVE